MLEKGLVGRFAWRRMWIEVQAAWRKEVRERKRGKACLSLVLA
jgi:hypothetical protein